jgi:hypothetical protein
MVTGTTASNCQSGGPVTPSPPPPEAAKSARPPAIPSTAPTSAGRTCASESPVLTCWGVAPSARASADEMGEGAMEAYDISCAVADDELLHP